MLVIGGEIDTLFLPPEQQKLADFYGADLKFFEDTAHNMMMEASYRESAEYLHSWLINAGIG